MKSIEIERIDQYIRHILELQQQESDFCIFRGQRVKAPLIQSIALDDRPEGIASVERNMLADLKRMGKLLYREQ